MKHLFILAQMFILSFVEGALPLSTCAQNKTTEENRPNTSTTQEWDKTFPLSEKVNHEKITFKTQYGFTLAADLYVPKTANGKMKAIAVSGPFGAIKEQCSGLYAMTMAELGFVTLAFDLLLRVSHPENLVVRHRPTSTPRIFLPPSTISQCAKM